MPLARSAADGSGPSAPGGSLGARVALGELLLELAHHTRLGAAVDERDVPELPDDKEQQDHPRRDEQLPQDTDAGSDAAHWLTAAYCKSRDPEYAGNSASPVVTS